MKRIWVFATALVAFAALTASAAWAIQYGEPDNGEHPYVGLMVAQDANRVPLWRCTGTLISPNRFLTAGHCTGLDPDSGITPSHVEIWFEEGPIPRGGYAGGSCVGVVGYPCTGDVGGTPHAHPGWTGYLTVPNTHDIGVVVLDRPVTEHGYGVVAGAGHLDPLATRRGLQDQSIGVVGYGLQAVKPVMSSVRVRLKATTQLVSLGSAFTDGYNVRVSSDPGKAHQGGTCFGDSGGPLFHAGKIVAVNSFVLNLNCKGSGYGYRTDTSDSLGFIGSFAP